MFFRYIYIYIILYIHIYIYIYICICILTLIFTAITYFSMENASKDRHCSVDFPMAAQVMPTER